jgi:hypothetical protein
MAFLPRMSIFGRWVGLTRETTTQNGQVLFSQRGFAGPYLYLHATEPTANSTSSIVDIEGLTTVTTQTTADTALSVRGISIIPAGASTLYTLAGPAAAGVRKVLFTTSTSTLSRQVKTAVSVVGGPSVGGDSGTISASSSFTVLSFTGQGNVIELVGLSTSAWMNVGLRGFSTGAAPLSS